MVFLFLLADRGLCASRWTTWGGRDRATLHRRSGGSRTPVTCGCGHFSWGSLLRRQECVGWRGSTSAFLRIVCCFWNDTGQKHRELRSTIVTHVSVGRLLRVHTCHTPSYVFTVWIFSTSTRPNHPHHLHSHHSRPMHVWLTPPHRGAYLGHDDRRERTTRNQAPPTTSTSGFAHAPPAPSDPMQPSYFAFDSSALWELWRYIQVWAVRISVSCHATPHV